jgi:NADPH-dependent 2,4-dienoyl-CoA reductase/sulfur reductase-like enzyme
MGASAAETVTEIEQTRDRLEEDLRELEDRMPKPTVWAKRGIGVAVGGGIAGTVIMFSLRRRKKKRALKVAANEPVTAVVNVLPEKWAENVSKAVEDGRWRGWAAGIGGAWLVLKLAELRQLRKLNHALVAGRH